MEKVLACLPQALTTAIYLDMKKERLWKISLYCYFSFKRKLNYIKVARKVDNRRSLGRVRIILMRSSLFCCLRVSSQCGADTHIIILSQNMQKMTR